MSLDVMKLALEALEEIADEVCTPYDNKLGDAILALRTAIEQAHEPETELETYKRLYELRGKALERPCSNCGHQPAKIKAMAQPEQELVCVCGAIWEDQELVSTPLPRQWQGLTNEELWELWNSHTEQPFPEWFVDFKRAYEVIAEKLKEKNNG